MNTIRNSYKGLFFLLGQPDDTVTGTLAIDAGGKGKLDLFGAFNIDNFYTLQTIQPIWGTLFNGDNVSLLDSYRGKGVYGTSGVKVNYRIGIVIWEYIFSIRKKKCSILFPMK